MSTRTMTQALFDHNDWARGKLLDAAAPLDDAALDRPFEIGPGSLRATLYHLWAAEQVWLNRWLGDSDRSVLDHRPNWPVAELRKHADATADARNAYVARLGDAGLSTIITYHGPQQVRYEQPVGELMMHACNHAVHHRAQALNMLRRLGVTPPRLDYLFMIREASAPPPPAFVVEHLQRCFAFGDWANDVVMSAAETLDDAALDRPVEMGVGSLRKTLLHIQDAEAWWWKNWIGESPDSFESMPDATSLPELRRRMQQTISDRNAYLAAANADTLARKVTARPRPGVALQVTIGDSMLQLFGHGTHHRAQAVNMLRHAGVAPPKIDYVIWVRD